MTDNLKRPRWFARPARPDGRPRRHGVWYLTTAGVLAIAAVVGLAAFGGFARHSFPVGPARVSTSATPSLTPRTTVSVPPFGSISAGTHVTPLALRVSLDEIDIPQLETYAAGGIPSPGALDAWTDEVRIGFRTAIGKGLLAALLAGAFAGWSLKRGWRYVLASATVAMVAPALLVTISVSMLDLSAFQTPTYRGAVAYAPSLIELVQNRARTVESLRGQVGKLVGDLARYYRAPQSFASAGALEGTYRVLHVTDLHLDPVGLELAEELTREFDVSLVIDTGDINHYGSELEADVVASQIPTDTPRLFVPGNHDSPAVVAALEALDNVTVIDGDTVQIDGLAVLGVADPSSASADVEPETDALEQRANEVAAELADAMDSGELTPTIVALHNPVMADSFDELAPLILAGHTHTAELERRGEAWYLNSGTTGGIHFSTLRTEPHIPHGASILYYSAKLPRRLVAIDQIEVFGLAGQSSVRRTVIDESLLP